MVGVPLPGWETPQVLGVESREDRDLSGVQYHREHPAKHHFIQGN